MAESAQPRIDAVFKRALELSDQERACFLDETCDRDAGLREAVERLLRNCELDDASLLQAGGGATGPLWEALAREYSTAFELAPGERLGPYRVMRVLGHGGTATVYLAERADGQFEQAVALKVLDMSRDFDTLAVRFAQERHILARLEHPNIARLIDGGTTRTGQPYVIMEYVDGEAIDCYCDRRALGVNERIALFTAVADAVQYAHGHLIVHRDIKPSNVLVNASGQPKLLDFGIAKLLEPDNTALAAHSVLHPMTPEYASPEQVRGEPLTTASDVYQLGFLLYHLLTGCSPYRSDRGNVAALLQAICRLDPVRPSSAVESSGEAGDIDTAAQRCAARATTPERLRRRLAGDLDTILLAALHKDPERRYRSASHFRDDLRRHLEGLPVAARKDTLGYRTRKFVRRNRLGVVAAALAVASLSAGFTAALWQAREKTREAARSEEVKKFLVSLFERSDPDVSKGESITARAMLDDGATRIERELDSQPGVQAELMRLIGEVYFKLGEFDQAERLAREALARFRTLHGQSHPETVRSLHALGIALREKGDYEGAEAALREALALWRRQLDPDDPEIATSLYDLGWTLRFKSDFEGAELLFREALAMQRARLGEEHEDVATSLYNLAWIRGDRGDYAESERLHREALAMRRKLLGEESLAVAQSLSNLPASLQFQGKVREAESLQREALALRRKLLGDDHPDVAATANNLALLVLSNRDYVEAERLFRQVLASYRQRLGDSHPYVATTLHNLATTLRNKGDYDAAILIYRDALALRRQLLGEDDTEVAQYVWNLAEALRRTGDLAESERLNRESLALRRRLLGDEHPAIIGNLNSLGLVLTDAGIYVEAEQRLREAVALSSRVLGEEHLNTAASLQNLGYALRRNGKLDEATTSYRAALAGFRRLLGDEHARTLHVEFELGLLHRDRGELAAAEPQLREVLSKQRALLGADHKDTRATEEALAALPRVH